MSHSYHEKKTQLWFSTNSTEKLSLYMNKHSDENDENMPWCYMYHTYVKIITMFDDSYKFDNNSDSQRNIRESKKIDDNIK